MNKYLIGIPVLNKLINGKLNISAQEWELVECKTGSTVLPKHQRYIPEDRLIYFEWKAKLFDKSRKNILNLRRTCKALYQQGIIHSYTVTMTRVSITFADEVMRNYDRTVTGSQQSRGVNLFA